MSACKGLRLRADGINARTESASAATRMTAAHAQEAYVQVSLWLEMPAAAVVKQRRPTFCLLGQVDHLAVKPIADYIERSRSHRYRPRLLPAAEKRKSTHHVKRLASRLVKFRLASNQSGLALQTTSRWGM